MFTPPPSPLPPIRQASPDASDTDGSYAIQPEYWPFEDAHNARAKQRLHSTIWRTIVLIPLALVLLAVYTRFQVHPTALDLFSTEGDRTWTTVGDWSPHNPHKVQVPGNRMVKRSTSSQPLPTSTATPVPTVPVDPTLPTPFPQPFDTTLSANFSTTSCYDFFLNMTAADPFRACRPFSLLISSSSAFLKAQKDINLMNTDVWGTCNTDISQPQCDANMSWFASTLQTQCETDLGNQVELAVETLTGLLAYDLMRNVACQVDPATNTYCYVEAVASLDPSSYWFYELPLGQPLGPNITTNACNQCTSGLMASYAAALDSANETSLTALARTYNPAVDTLNNVCGPSYAKAAQVSSNASSACTTAIAPPRGSLLGLGALVVLAGVLSGI